MVEKQRGEMHDQKKILSGNAALSKRKKLKKGIKKIKKNKMKTIKKQASGELTILYSRYPFTLFPSEEFHLLFR